MEAKVNSQEMPEELLRDKSSGHSGIRIVEVRIRNFRSLKSVDVKLDDLTVLIGANNSGKTSFLEALHAAIGAGRRLLSQDDIYIHPSEEMLPFDRSIIIDVLNKPTDQNGSISDHFSEGSYWLNLWRNGIGHDEADNEFAAFRTRLTWNRERGEYQAERLFLREWVSDSSNLDVTEVISEAGPLGAKHLEPLALHFMDARRDIEEDMRRQGSFWRRLTSDLGLNAEDINAVEEKLSQVNMELVQKSEVLGYIREHLGQLDNLMLGEGESVELTPVARKLRDLTRGIDVNFATKGAQSFPLGRHGMGTRSMASILIFRTFMNWRSKNVKDEEVHPVLALEEPEAHLHPQAQRALFEQISKIPGQVIVSTHSPYMAADADLSGLRHFNKEGAETTISTIDTGDLAPDELQKIKWKVMNTRGDMLFANALVLFEGETEEQALPIYAGEFWGRNPQQLGINFVGVGGKGAAYLPYLRLANGLKLRWYIFSDGDGKAPETLEKTLKKHLGLNMGECSNVIILPDGKNFESFLVDEGYIDVLTAFLEQHHEQPGFLTGYIERNHGGKGKGGKTRDYKSEPDGGKAKALLDILRSGKTEYSELIARELVNLPERNRRIPIKIMELFEQIAKDIAAPRAGEMPS